MSTVPSFSSQLLRLVLSLALLLCSSSLVSAQEVDLPGVDARFSPGETSPRAVLSRLKMPKVDFQDMPLRDVLEFLRQELAKHPEGASANWIVISVGPKSAEAGRNAPPVSPGLSPPYDLPAPRPPSLDTPVTLTLNNVSFYELLNYLANLTDCHLREDRNAVMFIVEDVPGTVASNRPGVPIAEGLDGPELDALLNPLRETKVPKIAFKNTPLTEALSALDHEARTRLPGSQGLPISIQLGKGKAPHLTLAAQNLSLLEALRYITELTGLQLKIEPTGLVITEYPQ